MKKITAMMFLAVSLFASLPVPGSMYALFHQTVVNRESNQSLRYEGKVWIKIPDEAKWIYEKPVKKIICVTKERAWVIEPELEQATLFQLKKAIPLMEILQKARKVSPGRYETKFEGTTYHIRTDSAKQLRSIGYEDDLGNRVTLTFEDIDTRPVEEKSLRCDIPKGYDIIDARYQ